MYNDLKTWLTICLFLVAQAQALHSQYQRQHLQRISYLNMATKVLKTFFHCRRITNSTITNPLLILLIL